MIELEFETERSSFSYENAKVHVLHIHNVGAFIIYKFDKDQDF